MLPRVNYRLNARDRTARVQHDSTGTPEPSRCSQAVAIFWGRYLFNLLINWLTVLSITARDQL